MNPLMIGGALALGEKILDAIQPPAVTPQPEVATFDATLQQTSSKVTAAEKAELDRTLLHLNSQLMQQPELAGFVERSLDKGALTLNVADNGSFFLQRGDGVRVAIQPGSQAEALATQIHSAQLRLSEGIPTAITSSWPLQR